MANPVAEPARQHSVRAGASQHALWRHWSESLDLLGRGVHGQDSGCAAGHIGSARSAIGSQALELPAVVGLHAPRTRLAYVDAKEVKHRKWHKGRGLGRHIATNKTTVAFGEYGLKAITESWVTARQLEAARRAMTRL